MADILPFKGVRYDLNKIKDAAKVVAPPYDVISKEEKKALYDASPYNIIRILLGEDFPKDNDLDNKYTRARKFLDEWTQKGILQKDVESSLYINLQEFKAGGKKNKRVGFMALLKLEDFDAKNASIYPHEYTLEAPKQDRTQLIQSINANLGPIFAIFGDEDKTIEHILKQEMRKPPLIDIVDSHGVRNKFWKISGTESLEKIVLSMKHKKLFIADGHHRYEVGLWYSKVKKGPAYSYILTYFTDINSKGIVILPTYRLISGISKATIEAFKKMLKDKFAIKDLKKSGIKRFLLKAGSLEKRFVTYDGRSFTGITLKHAKGLDVEVLHNVIINMLDKAAKENKDKVSIDFTKDLGYAISEVDKGAAGLSFLINPTKVTEVRDIALSGKRMPQKSTYFYPKVLTGLVINVFDV